MGPDKLPGEVLQAGEAHTKHDVVNDMLAHGFALADPLMPSMNYLRLSLVGVEDKDAE